VTVKLLSGNRVLADGVRGTGWIGESPTVPLSPVRQRATDVKLCFTIGQRIEGVGLDGVRARTATVVNTKTGQSLLGRMRIEFLRSGARSWLSLSSSVARRAGLGHWPAGTWTIPVVMAMVAAVVLGASWLTVREMQ
jgi:hypothetical protein